jgi:monovalent cation:H+ antiporter, CPA1 family
MTVFELIATLLSLSALFGWLNHRILHLPHSVGLLVLGLVSSLLLIVVELAFPAEQFFDELAAALKQIDFAKVVLDGVLAFLLFAGALNVNFDAMKRRMVPILLLAVPGTIVSTVVVGVLFWLVAGAVGYPISLAWSLAFGALISPTDPVAVLTMLKGVPLSENLRVEAEGESLFNDGIGIVLFTLLVGIAGGHESFDLGSATWDLVREAGGGVALGLVAGYIGYRGLKSIDDFPVEVLITLALVALTYALAQRLGLSGPLATVAAGLLVGNRAPKDAMSDRTQTYVSALWTLIDEVLNSVLFLLIGLEVLVINVQLPAMGLALLAVPITLFARFLAIAAPTVLPTGGMFDFRNVPFLTWAGVRGGISVALALALPESDAKSPILAATYAVVLFTIVVQGSTLPWVARHFTPATKDD